jgi:hypothetical protein
MKTKLPPLRFSPDTGIANPMSIEADAWRVYHEKVAWLYNPWTGNK